MAEEGNKTQAVIENTSLLSPPALASDAVPKDGNVNMGGHDGGIEAVMRETQAEEGEILELEVDNRVELESNEEAQVTRGANGGETTGGSGVEKSRQEEAGPTALPEDPTPRQDLSTTLIAKRQKQVSSVLSALEAAPYEDPYRLPAQLYARLATFRPSTWFGKPAALAAPVCALHGWINDNDDKLRCNSCGAVLYVPPESLGGGEGAGSAGVAALTDEKVGKESVQTGKQMALKIWTSKLKESHKDSCVWRIRTAAIDTDAYAFPKVGPANAVRWFRERYTKLLEFAKNPSQTRVPPSPLSNTTTAVTTPESQLLRIQIHCRIGTSTLSDLLGSSRFLEDIAHILLPDDTTFTASESSDHIDKDLALLALLGWLPVQPILSTASAGTAVSRSPSPSHQHAPTTNIPPAIHCPLCARKIPIIESTLDIDPLKSHHYYCPWVSTSTLPLPDSPTTTPVIATAAGSAVTRTTATASTNVAPQIPSTGSFDINSVAEPGYKQTLDLLKLSMSSLQSSTIHSIASTSASTPLPSTPSSNLTTLKSSRTLGRSHLQSLDLRKKTGDVPQGVGNKIKDTVIWVQKLLEGKVEVTKKRKLG